MSPSPSAAAAHHPKAREPNLRISDADARIQSVLPVGWYLVPLTGGRQLQLVDETGTARLYFSSYGREENLAETIEEYAEKRMGQLREQMSVIAARPSRPLEIAARRAIQHTASVQFPDGRPFIYCATFIDGGDRRDEVIADARHLEQVRDAVDEFLQALEYRR